MKEKDLDKNLENIMIDGLIKEAEQDNADFAAAVRKMSKETFDSIVKEPTYADYDQNIMQSSVTESVPAAASIPQRKFCLEKTRFSLMTYDEDASLEKAELSSFDQVKPNKASRSNLIRPWITAAVSAAAVILIVLIPSINSMNAKLCESALYMSEAYITAPKGGFDISSATTEQIKEELPDLERQYQSTIEKDGKSVYYRDGFQDAGWTLAVAYLKLHKKSDAIKVLKTLESRTEGTPFGNHCNELLKQLD